MDSKFERTLYGSPLAEMRGMIILALFLLSLFLVAFPGFKEYYSKYPLQLAIGILLGCVLYCPTIFALRYFDRREREPWQLAIFTIFSVTLFFGPVTSHCFTLVERFISPVWLVGLIEEFWKIVPMLLLVSLIPRAVNGTRDGLIYGALCGFGFAILEFSANTVFDYFPAEGWAAFKSALGRWNILGTHNHIIWSAAIGSVIGWATTQRSSVKRFLLPVATYLGIALLHTFEDKGGNILTTMVAGALIEPIVLMQENPEAFVKSIMVPFLIWGGTVNLLLINIVVFPFLFRALRRSGDREREIIRRQLENESDQVITGEEYDGVKSDRRFKTRYIPGLTRAAGDRLVQMQNELAFHKEFASAHGNDPESAPPVEALRKIIAAAR